MKPSLHLSVKFGLLICLFVLCNMGCGLFSDDKPDEPRDQFDRAVMLTDWADILIIPNYTNYLSKLESLNSAKDQFSTVQDNGSFNSFRSAYLDAYEAWQYVSMYEIGMAEQIGLRNYTNIYPTDVEGILSNINTPSVELSLPSNFDAQGFPALDYLLYGSADSDEAIISYLLESGPQSYVDRLITRLVQLTTEVLDDWQGGYRTTFIENDESSATASVDKLVNDYLFYYEKFLRAGKVAIPAGVFTGSELPGLVEAPYSRIYSKELLSAGLDATIKFFNGESLDGQSTGISIADYLDHNTEAISSIFVSHTINDQWEVIRDQLASVENDLYSQVENDNSQMLSLYDEMQKNVVSLKVDMMMALNIQVDFVDADGD